MNIGYASTQDLGNGEGRRRLFTRTQTSAFRQAHREYHLVNNIYSKQSTVQTVGSNGSEHEHKSRSRVKSTSSKSLFGGIKHNNYSDKRLLLQKRDNFVIPTKNFETMTIEHDDVKQNLQKVLEQKLNRKTQLKIRDEVQNAAMRRIVEQANKKLMRNRIQSTYNLKLQQRKQNLEKNMDNKKFNSMVSDYVQTDLENELKKAKQGKRRMIKTQAYSIQVPSTSLKKENLSQKPEKQVKNVTENKKQGQEQSNLGVVSQISKTPRQQGSKQTKNKETFNNVESYFSSKQVKNIGKEQKGFKKPVVHTPKQGQARKISQTQYNEGKSKQNVTQKVNSQGAKKQSVKQTNKKQPSKNNGKSNKYDDIDQLQELENVVLTVQSKMGPKKDSEKSPTIKSKQQPKQSKEAKQKAQLEQKQKKQKEYKQSITQQLTLANKIIDLITPMGQVAGYCSQLLKKSQLNWQTPAILLYKDCYQKFKLYEQVYKKASSLGIIDKSESDRFEEDNKMIEKNLDKVLKMGKKKQRISQQYEKLILSQKCTNLDSIIQKQVLDFGSSVLSSEQKTNKDVIMCLLRMINGVLIIAQIRGFEVQTLDNIQQLENSEKLQQIAIKQLLSIQPKKFKL